MASFFFFLQDIFFGTLSLDSWIQGGGVLTVRTRSKDCRFDGYRKRICCTVALVEKKKITWGL